MVVRLDARITIKQHQLRSMRLRIQVALELMINPAVTQKHMETVKPTSFPMASYTCVSTQSEWRTIVLGWIRQPGNLNKYLEIAGGIVVMHSRSAWLGDIMLKSL